MISLTIPCITWRFSIFWNIYSREKVGTLSQTIVKGGVERVLRENEKCWHGIETIKRRERRLGKGSKKSDRIQTFAWVSEFPVCQCVSEAVLPPVNSREIVKCELAAIASEIVDRLEQMDVHVDSLQMQTADRCKRFKRLLEHRLRRFVLSKNRCRRPHER